MTEKYISEDIFYSVKLLNRSIALDPQQFADLVAALETTDWLALIIQVIVQLAAVGLAAFAAYKYEVVLRKRDKNESEKIVALKLNEATINLATFQEGVASHLEQLVVKNFEKEKKFYEALRKGFDIPSEAAAFTSIRPIKLKEMSDFLLKLPNLGHHYEIVRAYNRLTNEIDQFADICKQRIYIITKIIESRDDYGRILLTKDKYNEVFILTSQLVISGESILDTVLYLAESLNPLQIDTRNRLIAKEIRGVKIVQFLENDFIKSLYKKINEIVNSNFPEHSQRFLYSRKTDV